MLASISGRCVIELAGTDLLIGKGQMNRRSTLVRLQQNMVDAHHHVHKHHDGPDYAPLSAHN
jgi:hypothetical protein